MKRFEPLNEKQSRAVLTIVVCVIFIILICIGAAMSIPAQASVLAWNKTATPTEERHHKTDTPTKKPYNSKTPTQKPDPTKTPKPSTETAVPSETITDTLEPTFTPEPTHTFTPAPTDTPEDTATSEPTATSTPKNHEPDDTDTPEPSDTPRVLFLASPTPTVTSTETQSPLGFAAIGTPGACDYQGCCCCCQQPVLQPPAVFSIEPPAITGLEEIGKSLDTLNDRLAEILTVLSAILATAVGWTGYSVAKSRKKE